MVSIMLKPSSIYEGSYHLPRLIFPTYVYPYNECTAARFIDDVLILLRGAKETMPSAVCGDLEKRE